MQLKEARRPAIAPNRVPSNRPPHIVVGITSSQTCLNLIGRLAALRDAGFRVTLISSPGKLLDEITQREGAEAVAIPIKRTIAPWADLVSLVQLWWMLILRRPDLTEFSTPKAGLLGSIASLLAGVPRRVYMLRGLKLESTKGLKRRILLITEKVAARCSQVVLCNSESMRREALALGIAPAGKLKVLGDGSTNGVNLTRFSPGPSDVLQRLGIPADAPIVGFVGRLTADKGVPELIEAFDAILNRVPEAHLLLVGWFDAAEDALSQTVRKRIEAHTRIHCTGYTADAAPYYRVMDLMVLPTWREGFPNAVLEAAATGIPVVTPLCTGSRDSVVPEVTGLLIPPGYPEAISEAVLKILLDKELRLRMGAAARRWVMEHYTNDRVLGLLTSYYKSLLEESPPEPRAHVVKVAEAAL
jgi:glycosyltransferase involved in cell wall biosynthesis